MQRRVDALGELLGLSRTRVDPDALAEAGELLDRVAERRRLSLDHTVVALAGATGGGKSSLFNALTGLDLSEVGVRRPTTQWPVACAWDPRGAVGLLDRLGIPPHARFARRSLLDGVHTRPGGSDTGFEGLILLDLPDHDSASEEHRRQVDRLLKLVDVTVWVVDPEKYADALLHERYLRPLAGHADVTLIVLNQVDRLPYDAADQVLDDLRRLLDEDGLALGEHGEAGAVVLSASALTGEGVADVRAAIGQIVADRGAADRRLAADVDRATERLRPVYVGYGCPGLTDDARENFVARLAEAVGADAVGRLAEREWTDAASRACGVPWSRLVERTPGDHSTGPSAGASDPSGVGGRGSADALRGGGSTAPGPLATSAASRAEAATGVGATDAVAAASGAVDAATGERGGSATSGANALRPGAFGSDASESGVSGDGAGVAAGADGRLAADSVAEVARASRLGALTAGGSSGTVWGSSGRRHSGDLELAAESTDASDLFDRAPGEGAPPAAVTAPAPERHVYPSALSDVEVGRTGADTGSTRSGPPLTATPAHADSARLDTAHLYAARLDAARRADEGPTSARTTRATSTAAPVNAVPRRRDGAARRAAARPLVAEAVRAVAAEAADGLPTPWSQAVHDAAQRGSRGLPEALDVAVAKADECLVDHPRWWSVVGMAQWLLMVLSMVGVVGLVAVAVRAVPVPVWLPAVVFGIGTAGGPLLAWACRAGSRGTARRYGQTAERRLRGAAADCGRTRVLEPVAAELLRYQEVREQYGVAKGVSGNEIRRQGV